MTQPYRIVRGLGGNGGTYICRALAAMERVVLLSETNPSSANLFAFGLNPATQIEAHRVLVDERERLDLLADDGEDVSDRLPRPRHEVLVAEEQVALAASTST